VPHPLALTGERTLPGLPGEQYWFARHEAAYAWLASHVVDRTAALTVVDAGSGEGYGAAMLRAAGARRVLAVEYDPAAAAHAAATYPGVGSVRANLVTLPLRSECSDLVVSLQVVEHLWDLTGFLRECHRVLRPGGRLVLTTPNRPVFSPGLGRGQRPTNPFHVEEFDAAQLVDLLRRNSFDAATVRGLHHGDRLAQWEREQGVGLVAAQVALITGAGQAPAGTTDLVASCTAADFVVAGAHGAQDLLVSAVRP
jgi:SAM-dependent methyltransferase